MSARWPRRTGDRRRRLIAAIHVTAWKAGLSGHERRALQERAGGAASCADMDDAGLGRVLDALRQLPAGTAGRVGPPRDDVAGMRRKCLAIAADLGAGSAYVDAIAERQAGKPLDACGAAEVRGVIAALYARRRKVRSASA